MLIDMLNPTFAPNTQILTRIKHFTESTLHNPIARDRTNLKMIQYKEQ